MHIMVLYIYQQQIKGVTEMKTKDTLENIVPLVLPTQLDSKDSDSENEKTEDGD